MVAVNLQGQVQHLSQSALGPVLAIRIPTLVILSKVLLGVQQKRFKLSERKPSVHGKMLMLTELPHLQRCNT